MMHNNSASFAKIDLRISTGVSRSMAEADFPTSASYRHHKMTRGSTKLDFGVCLLLRPPYR